MRIRSCTDGETGWVRYRVRSCLDSAYFDDGYREKERYDNPSIELAADPDFLLLEEPTSDLDPRNAAVIEAAIGDARARGLGVVIATHDMHQAERVADRVAVMIEDAIIDVGPTDRVFEASNDRRARQFIDGELVY